MRHRPVYDLPDWGKTDARVLDAAEQLIISRGLDGLSITSIANKAGISRPTVYRRWPSVDEIMRATLLRATAQMLEQAGTLPQTRDQLVQAILGVSQSLRTHALYRSLIDRHPEVFLQYSIQRLGASQLVIVSWFADAIELGQQNGTIKDGSPTDLAVLVLLMAQSAILSHQAVVSLIGQQEFRAQLAAALHGYLQP